MVYAICSGSFFFASRRRHTSWPRDWSSDVCSSDLGPGLRFVRDRDVHSRRIAGTVELVARDECGDPCLLEIAGLCEESNSELGSDPGEVAEGQCDTWCGCGHHRPLPWSAVGGESSELRPISNRIEDNPTTPERRVKGTNQASSGNIWRSGQRHPGGQERSPIPAAARARATCWLPWLCFVDAR